MVPGIVEQVRQPEYTGENRCLPCTAVNVALTGAGSLLVAAAVERTGGAAAGVAVGLVVLALGLGAVWLRGYLVPGTPALTRRYLPDPVLRRFGKAPAAATVDPVDPDGDVDVESSLLELGALEPCGDDYCLAASFRERWHDRIDRFDDSDWAPLLARVGVADANAAVETADGPDGPFVVHAGGRRVGTWESRAAARADLAAVDLLADRLDGWATLSPGERVQLSTGLRLFLETCPACGGPVSFDTETVESCCMDREVAVTTCEECAARLFESPVNPGMSF